MVALIITFGCDNNVLKGSLEMIETGYHSLALLTVNFTKLKVNLCPRLAVCLIQKMTSKLGLELSQKMLMKGGRKIFIIGESRKAI